MTSLATRAGAALELRSAILCVFGSAPVPDAALDTMQRASKDAWRLVLHAENCAVPLMRRLPPADVKHALPADVIGVIGDAQIQETQRVMAARGVLRDLDRVASGLGIRATIIKGGALAATASRDALDLGDVDVLVSPAHATPLWNALVASGWHKGARGADATSADPAYRGNHFGAMSLDQHSMKLELHIGLRYGNSENYAPRIAREPLPGFSALDRPVGAAYVSMLLRHSVVAHPFRRGHIRDLVLIAKAVQELSPRELDAVRTDARADVFAPELLAMLEQAQAIADGVAPPDSPLFLPHIARKYLGALGYGGPLAQLPEWASMSHLGLERPPVRRTAYRSAARDALGPLPSGLYFDRMAARSRIRPAARALAWGARSAYSLALLAGFRATEWMIRRDVRQVLDAASALR